METLHSLWFSLAYSLLRLTIRGCIFKIACLFHQIAEVLYRMLCYFWFLLTYDYMFLASVLIYAIMTVISFLWLQLPIVHVNMLKLSSLVKYFKVIANLLSLLFLCSKQYLLLHSIPL